jgi:hypothetical protein
MGCFFRAYSLVKPPHLPLNRSVMLGGFVVVMQATKSEKYKGDSAFAHDTDVIMKLDNKATNY